MTAVRAAIKREAGLHASRQSHAIASAAVVPRERWRILSFLVITRANTFAR